MVKRSGGREAPKKTATGSTREGELTRHLAAIGVASADAYRSWCRENGFTLTLDKGWKERRAERECAERLRERTVALDALAGHFRALGVADEAAYFAWCRLNGFAESLAKRPRQCEEERLAQSRDQASMALSAARGFNRRPDDILQAIAKDEVDPEQLKRPHLQAIQTAFASLTANPAAREALLRLLLHCRQGTKLLTVDCAIAHLGLQSGNSYVGGLTALARRREEWLRDPVDWRPESHSARRQFGALARHLLARYQVPPLMDAAWFLGEDPRAEEHQRWFIHIGRGGNIRAAGLPLRITKRAAHLFHSAPRDLPIEAALRWAQVLALGGDELLARALLATRLAELQLDEPFWETVLFFFINNPMLDFGRVGAVVDYLHHRRFVPVVIEGPDGRPAGTAIAEPQLSMKGRTGIALLRRVDDWHRDLARETKRAPITWEPSGIGGFSSTTRDAGAKADVTWTVQELLSSRALRDEGKEMHHCVASYGPACVRGATSIWSLQIQEGAGATARRVMTIEVNNSRRTVVQARGRCNKTPGDKRSSSRLAHAPDLVRRWAAAEGLSVPGYLFGR